MAVHVADREAEVVPLLLQLLPGGVEDLGGVERVGGEASSGARAACRARSSHSRRPAQQQHRRKRLGQLLPCSLADQQPVGAF